MRRWTYLKCLTWPQLRANLTLAVMLLFLAAWSYTEISEHFERVAFNTRIQQELADMQEFRDAGERFTAKRGDALEARVEQLEQERE